MLMTEIETRVIVTGAKKMVTPLSLFRNWVTSTYL
jgi:hypothetical protein